MLAHSRPGAGSRPGNGAAKAGAGGRSAPPLQPAPALTRRALVHPVPSPRPTPGLVRQRPQRQRPQELPGATPEQQQQFPGSELDAAAKAEAAAAKLQRYPWHSDEWKEEYRKQVRVTFDFERWRTHRSSSRFWRHMAGLAQSNTAQGLAQPLAYVMAVSLGVAAYHVAAAAGWLPLWPVLKLAANAPFGLTSFALSLLLVFRTNSSYGRWDEARKMWGLVVNRSRDLTRQALGYIPAHQAELQSMLCRWVVAYSRCLMCHLREGEDLEAELRGVLLPEEVAELLAAEHRPNYCCQVLTEVLREAQLPAAVTSPTDSTGCVPAGAAYRMDENLTVFEDVTGGCERLLRTPIPLAYTRHTSRFMMAWLTILPFALWDTCGWAMLPVMAIVAFVLLGIEEIGVSIEEPFSILPLETICRTIESNVRESVGAHCQRQARRAQQAQHGGVPGDLPKRHAHSNGNNAVPALLFMPPQPVASAGQQH